MHRSPRLLVLYWGPPIAWMALILIASSDLMSAEHTSRFIGPVLRWMFPDIAAEQVTAVQFYVRKTAHVIEYAILGVLLMRALAAGVKMVAPGDVVVALVVALLCAGTDEFHQSLVRSRTGSPFDVMLDLAGAYLGVITYLLVRRRTAPPPAA